MELKVRDIIIKIPNFVIDKIPLIESLNETKSDQMIELTEISPRFLKHIIEYFNNDQKPLFLKSKLNEEFEEFAIKKYLKYLGLDVLLNRLYKSHKIDDKIIIYSIYSFRSKEFHKVYECVLNDGSVIKAKDIVDNNILIRIQDEKIKLVNKLSIDVFYWDEWNDIGRSAMISKENVLEDVDGYYMSPSIYKRYHLSDYTAFSHLKD